MNAADTAWILTATALVLMMTLPGLALFYGGLVRVKNVISIFMQCFSIAAVASVLWVILGYSLAFDGTGAVIGGLGKAFLLGVRPASVWNTIPEPAFVLFQMTFAIITPCLIIGAFVERIKFSFVVAFSALWLLLVYVPVTHWIWGSGFLASQFATIDFAGGLVVHETAGLSALVVAFFLRARRGFPSKLIPPHSPVLTAVGAGLLWVGWFGFNGGSQLAADGGAANAALVTHVSAATAVIAWVALDVLRFGKATLIGAVTGMVAGLATITPAAGVAGVPGALLLGLLSGVICNLACGWVKGLMKIDDSLDVFAVHGIGGMLGALLAPLVGAVWFGGQGIGSASFLGQIASILIVGVYTLAVTVPLVLGLRALIGLRVDDEEEDQGLDLASHGESNA